jgi:hypothetical protein
VTKFNFLLIAVFSFILAACATPMSVPLDKQTYAASSFAANPQMAQIYFYREKNFQGSMRGIYITVDGQRVGGLNSGTYFVHEVLPGAHTFSVEDWLGEDPSRTITVNAGEQRYLKGSLQFGFWDAQPRIEIVANEEGQAAIQQLTYGILKNSTETTPAH